MKTYTQKQIEELIDYLNYSVKEGYDETVAMDMITRKAWGEIEALRDKADFYAENPDAPTELDEIRASEGLD